MCRTDLVFVHSQVIEFLYVQKGTNFFFLPSAADAKIAPPELTWLKFGPSSDATHRKKSIGIGLFLRLVRNVCGSNENGAAALSGRGGALTSPSPLLLLGRRIQSCGVVLRNNAWEGGTHSGVFELITMYVRVAWALTKWGHGSLPTHLTEQHVDGLFQHLPRECGRVELHLN